MVFSVTSGLLGRSRFLLVCVLLSVSFTSPAFALNCVEYARKVSGLDISGDGWQWWSNAAGRYERGHAPKENAIMVFDRTPNMEHGHVAVVSRVLNPRLITVNHANWAHLHSLRGHVNTGVMVQDVSDKNDWTEVKVMDESSQSYGRSNRILGFVYNKPGHGPVNDPSLVAENTDSPSAAKGATRDIKDIDNE